MNSNTITAKVFLYARTKYGMSQYEMAKKLGVNQSTICRIEQEVIYPNAKLLQKVQAISGLNIEDLIRAAINIYALNIKV